MQEGRLEKALELFKQGLNVNKVASAMGVAWITAKAYETKLIEAGQLDGAAPKRAGGGRLKRKSRPPRPAADKLPEAFDLSLTVPTGRMRDIFAEFTVQEQADAIASVLQARMDAALN